MSKPDRWQIAIQGTRGSFTLQALQEFMAADYPGQDHHVHGFNTFDLAVEAFNKRRTVKQMFTATFNNNSGSVHAMALLYPVMDGFIVGEYYLAVKQCLLVRKGVKESRITEVISQRPALDQCRANIAKRGWKTSEYKDTALAAKHVSSSEKDNIAAIASPLAGTFYGLDNLGDIGDNPGENFTRFFHIVGPDQINRFLPAVGDGKYRTTALARGMMLNPDCLKIISDHGISMSRFETLANGSFDPSSFLIDFDAHMKSPDYVKCKKKLSDYNIRIREIGCYAAKPRPLSYAAH